MSKNTPYTNLPARAYWRSAVSDRTLFEINDLWRAKYSISPSDRIITAGSCFAQHISRALTQHGYKWFNAESAPPILSDADKQRFGYGVFSFRTGNIYTVALLYQWMQWSLNNIETSSEVWFEGGRYYDPFRPNIEPNGFDSLDEMIASRRTTMSAIKRAVSNSNIFIFTLGLTEGWVNNKSGDVYPMCPGTHAGTYSAEDHQLFNTGYTENYEILEKTMELLWSINPKLKFLLTVSPVPLTATASNEHVVVATTYSKSILRAVAGDISAKYSNVDYFPSYEIISSFPFKGIFYMPNLRSVAKAGVDFVMAQFISALGADDNNLCSDVQIADDKASADDVVCEDAILEYYNEN